MKNLSLYIMSLLTVGFTACTEDFNEGITSPQNWEEEAAKNMTFASAGVSSVDLGSVTGDSVVVCTFTAPVVEGAVLSYKMKLDDKEVVKISAQGKAAVTELQNAVIALYGKRPVERTMAAVVTAYASLNGGVLNVPAAGIELKITPKAPLIESAYYLYGAPTGWSKDNVLPFTHSEKDVYEDPIFTIMVPAVLDELGNVIDCYIKIASQSSVDAQKAGSDLESVGILGSAKDGDEALKGTLVLAKPQAIKIVKGDYKFIKITLNMMDYTYEIETINASAYLWVPGDQQGWAPASALQLYSPKLDLIYSGHLFLNGGFKLTGQNSWPVNGVGVDYGYDAFSSLSDNISKDGSNMSVTEGFYYLSVDLTQKTIAATLTQWGIIGTAIGGWGDADDKMMTYDSIEKCWTVTADFVADEFKFRANHSWDINMGGTAEKLIFNNSNNLKMAEAGNYTVKLYLINDEHSYCTLTKN